MKSAFAVPIVQRRDPAPGHVEFILANEALSCAAPGQFCHVLTPGMLRRPLSFSRMDSKTGCVGVLLQVVGPGTEWLYGRQVGESLDVLGPLGRGFVPPDPRRPWLLIGGGVGIPPIFAAYGAWRDRMRERVTVVLGARTRDALIMADDFSALGLSPVVVTDDGSRGEQGTVMGPAGRWLDQHPDGQVMACGPTPMLARVHQEARRVAGPMQLALEQRMGCGIGACLACVIPATPVGPQGPRYRRVCTDGPVFSHEELVFSWT